MTDSLHHSIFAGKNLSQTRPQGITEADVLMTGVLASRPARQPDFAAENQALRTLAQHLRDKPQSLLKTLVGIALNLCRADTVGVSLLEIAPNGESLFRWVALAGALEQFEQTTTPGNFSPCGTTLACNQPQLYSHPERYFTYLYHPQFPIAEGLLIPLCVDERSLGTLWIVSHSGARHFDAEDQRLMMSLGAFAVSALDRMQQLQQTAATALHQSEQLNQQILDSSDDCIKILDLEGRILFMSRGGQASLSIQDITPFLNRPWLEFWQESEQQAAIEAINRARAGEVSILQGYCPALSGEPKWWDNKVSPIRGVDGQVERLLCISRDITDRVRVEDERRRIENDRKQTEEKLRESEERYRAIVNQAVTGVACTDLDGKLTLVNQKYCDITGYSAAELSQLRMHDITHPEDLPPNVELFNRMLAEGTPFEIEKRYIRKDGAIVWVNNSVWAICDRQGKPQSLVAIVLDITERKRREANASFLAEITQDFSCLSTPDEIMQAVGAKIGAFMNLPYCHFMSIDEARDEVVYLDRWNAENVPRLPDKICLSEQVSEEFYRFVRAGETVVSNNTQTNPITNAQANAEIGAMSFITVPFHQGGEWKYLFSVHDIRPRNWRGDEIELVRELANRVFPRLERARAEDALRASEAKYRSLFESMDEGFCILQLIFDEKNKPIDYRYIEINPVFEQQTGMKNALGRTIRELVPNIEPFWFDIYGTVALTGKPTRFVDHAQSMGRWFDVNAFRIGEPHERKVAVLFNDISDRKQAEETLQQAHNALRQQTNQLERANAFLQSTLKELQVTQEELRQQNEDLAIARELAEREGHRYQDLFNFAPDGYVVTDARGIIQEANQAIAALVAIDQQYLVNTPLVAYISEPDRRVFRNLLYQLHRQSGVQKLQTDELSLQHPGRHPAPLAPIPVAITGTAIYDAQSQVVGVRWLIQDISDRKQAEAQREQLLANERQYVNQLQGLTNAALAINSALSVEEVLKVITDQAALIIGAHQSVASMTIDQNWAQAINAIYLSEKYAAWQDYDEQPDGSGIYAYICQFNRSMRMTQAELDVHPRWKSFGKEADKHPPVRGWLAAPLVGRDGQNIGLIQLSDKYEGEFTQSDESILVQLAQMASIAVENARLYEAEQQTRSAAEASREEAEAANRVKDEFLAVLSHELRSPLNPILGWSKLLQNRQLDAAKTAKALATIERNAKLQSELIDDLLDVSRILQGSLSLNVAPVNLASIIRAAMETVRLAADAKSIQLKASLEPDVDLVAGDSTRLQQVIWNLLSNAVKFTPPRGQVNIQLECLEGSTQITVSDTGQGIAPDFLPYVFDYFRQANATTTRKFGGLGLGLAIARHLVELHGGTVRAESLGERQGATFIVQLPLMATTLKVNPDEQEPELPLDLKGIKILVVDDEADTLELVVFLLQQQGAQVQAATSAHEALMILTQTKPDILLSDIGMPDMDGYMLIQQVRMLPPEQGGQIPAIALTAYAGETNQQQVIAAGFQKHISKPIEPEVLVQAIRSTLDNSGQDSQTQA